MRVLPDLTRCITFCWQGVPAAITADPYLRILHNHQPLLSWKEELGEHSLTYMVCSKMHTACMKISEVAHSA